jgi:quercetin dioxygenase-like cupin family protein
MVWSVAALALVGCGGAPPVVEAGPPIANSNPARIVMAHPLPPLDGAHLAVTVVEVHYGPGGSSKPHRHPCPVVGYVIEGTYRSQVQGAAETTYTADQSFYESPDAVHLVSANASAERPVRFLAVFTCDRDTPLSVAEPHDSVLPRP